MSNEENKYKVVATKVSAESWRALRKICKKKGLTPYDFLQMVVYTIVRYGDDRHNLTADMERAMSIFEHMQGWEDALNLSDPNMQRVIGEAIYFLCDDEGKKHGTVPIHVTRPFFGNWSETCNIQTIVERFFSLALPERYMRMRRLAVDMECKSLLELFDALIDQHSKDADVAHIRHEFEDARRSEWGKAEWEQPYRRKHHKDPDSPVRDLFHPNHIISDE